MPCPASPPIIMLISMLIHFLLITRSSKMSSAIYHFRFQFYIQKPFLFYGSSPNLYENPPLPPFGKGGVGGFSCFVVPAPGMGVSWEKGFIGSPTILEKNLNGYFVSEQCP
jgi:hypothetical protein